MTPEEIRATTFEKQSMGGYRRSDVDSFLSDVAAEMSALIKEKQDTEQKLVVLAQKIEEYRKDEDNVKTALLNAQRMAESIVREARQKSEAMLREAGIKADDLVQNARSQVEDEQSELERVQNEVSLFKAGLLQQYKRHIELLNALPEKETTEPADVPQETAEPAPAEAVKIEEPVAEEPPAEIGFEAFQGIKFSD